MADHRKPYGVGLGHRNIIHDDIIAHQDEIDVLEIFTESYIIRQRRLRLDPQCKLLNEALELFPCVSHGVGLSIGTVDELDTQVLKNTKQFLDETGIHCHGEHLTFHRLDDYIFTFFLCMPFEDNSIDWLRQRYAAARGILGLEIALENVSYHFAPTRCEYDEPDFLKNLLECTNASLLLDVTNVFNNCTNHNIDPVDYIHRLPADRISMIHLAGGHYEDGFLVDSHSHPVMPEVWELFDETMRYTKANIVTIERDENFQPFSQLFGEVCQAREIFYKHRPAECPDPPLDWTVAESERDVSPPDPKSTEFVDLGNFQRAIVREIADDHFRLQVRNDRDSVQKIYPMSDLWFERWRECPSEHIDAMAKLYRAADKFNKQDEENYKRSEWNAWANM